VIVNFFNVSLSCYRL